ncbi:ATP-binding cassette domain-containing protein [Microbacterium azadirachtae]|uniref:Glutathione import ATP-binding protein GsiA n=1 Tax=Microbacterium azadirachtae TaxID=582680 RepID=A0A0F0LNK0_9MICO|nr:ATP-binding cassette domain-containing protein [Microbacterium azadirachtae]KJL33131.1 Glutathione import ATP-binding protein GsiA [Microbacterium azadirachtae]SDM32118.1 ABC transporter [Microbacterium azadirachtae]SEG46024.1 ABC transporter [Microbacterium azadirachtae]SEG53587.1 ABC transporter [Microbacterium azadirachtae]
MTALLEVQDLVVEYGRGRKAFRALHGVSIDVAPGECMGLVGESGSGKSTLGKAILGLAPVTSGSIRFDGRDITALGRAERRALAADVQVVFQDPYGSLNPAMTIGEILTEPLLTSGLGGAESQRRVREMLDRVRLPEAAMDRYPSEFSGGQRQRVAIARALVRRPRLIVCDEPVSALDLTTQATILDLFIELQRDTGVSYLFVSHDLGVVRRVCHRVAVMYRGEIVETGEGEQITRAPRHPYAERLRLASPVADPVVQRTRRAEWLALREAADAPVR